MTLLDFGNLTDDQSERYDLIASEIESDFNGVIGSIYKSNKENRNWYFSTVASRSPFQSPLFERLCKLRLLDEQRQKNKENTLIVSINDYEMYKLFLSSLPESEKITIVFTGEKRSLITLLVKHIWNLSKYVGVVLVKTLVTLIFCKKKICDKPVILVDTFVCSGEGKPGTVTGEKYLDRYFPKLFSFACKNTDSKLLYLPTLILDKHFMRTFLKFFKVNNFLVKEGFLGFADWIGILKLPFKRIKINKEIYFDNYNVASLVVGELLLNKFSLSKLIAEINYRFVKGLKKSRYKLDFFIEWYENQVVDRGMILGLRNNFPNVRICGYEGYVVCPIYNFYISPTKYELNHNLTPDSIAVTGEALSLYPSRYIEIKTILSPAFRFSNLYQKRIHQCNKNNITIAVPFSICIQTSFDNLTLLCNAVNNKCKHLDIEILVKMHPAFDSHKIGERISSIDDGIIISKENFNHILQKSDVLVGSASSACVEALVFGVSVLITANRNGLTSNPVPHAYRHFSKVCYNETDISTQLNNIANKNIALPNTDQVLNQCFREVNYENVTSFINELNN